jgi:hypothetical protein
MVPLPILFLLLTQKSYHKGIRNILFSPIHKQWFIDVKARSVNHYFLKRRLRKGASATFLHLNQRKGKRKDESILKVTRVAWVAGGSKSKAWPQNGINLAKDENTHEAYEDCVCGQITWSRCEMSLLTPREWGQPNSEATRLRDPTGYCCTWQSLA